MTRTSHIVAFARLVRITSMTFAMTLLVAFVALQAFAAQYGSSEGTLVNETASSRTELTVAISLQESAGLTCTERPALTDTILFQEQGIPTVHVISFDQALAASRARAGFIRRYCV